MNRALREWRCYHGPMPVVPVHMPVVPMGHSVPSVRLSEMCEEDGAKKRTDKGEERDQKEATGYHH